MPANDNTKYRYNTVTQLVSQCKWRATHAVSTMQGYREKGTVRMRRVVTF